jgi:hypothetical protein
LLSCLANLCAHVYVCIYIGFLTDLYDRFVLRGKYDTLICSTDLL